MREFRLIFAACDSSGIWRGDIADKIAARLAATYGGYTRTESRGGFVMADGALITESVFVFDVAADGESVFDFAAMAAAEIRREMNQESVYFRDIDGGVHLLTADAKPDAETVDDQWRRTAADDQWRGHASDKYCGHPLRAAMADADKPQRTAADADKLAESLDQRAAKLAEIAESMAAADDRRGGGQYNGAAAICARAADITR